jgi:ATP adenylyltransferase
MPTNPPLYAPWRMDYIRGLDKPDNTGCFLCDAATCPESDFRKRLVLWRTVAVVVLLNRYPYTNGHMLVAPLAHKAEFDVLTDAELLDLQRQTAAAVRLLKRGVAAQGFNIGINVGRIAGAGVPGHVHQHVVPRWAGDTNFISVVGDVRIVPQATNQLYDELTAMVADGKTTRAE